MGALTDEEIDALYEEHASYYNRMDKFARAIESAAIAKIKAHGAVAYEYKSEDPFDSGESLLSRDLIDRKVIYPLYRIPEDQP